MTSNVWDYNSSMMENSGMQDKYLALSPTYIVRLEARHMQLCCLIDIL